MVSAVQARSRGGKWSLYESRFPPRTGELVLDVGVSRFALPTENYFLDRYPYPCQVTGVGVSDLSDLPDTFPGVTFMQADGRELPFDDRAFDVAHSNAVVEHVGHLSEQAAFVREVCRVSRAGIITTPYRWFPVESHTRLPLAHYMPRGTFVRVAGHIVPSAHAESVWLLSERQFVNLFPDGVQVSVVRGRLLGLTATLAVVYRWVARRQ